MTEVTVIDSTAQNQIKSIIERVERLNEDADAVKNDLKEVFSEARGNGFDVKILKRVIKLRKISKAAREEESAILDLYLHAIGEI